MLRKLHPDQETHIQQFLQDHDNQFFTGIFAKQHHYSPKHVSRMYRLYRQAHPQAPESSRTYWPRITQDMSGITPPTVQKLEEAERLMREGMQPIDAATSAGLDWKTFSRYRRSIPRRNN